MIPPEDAPAASPASDAEAPLPTAAEVDALAAREIAQHEGSQLFHAALVFGLVPGVSVLLAAIGYLRLREASPRWARRLAALGALDVGVLLAMVVATVMTASTLGGSLLATDAPAPSTVGAPAPLALGPRPRIGVVVEDAEEGGVRVRSVLPGSPASLAGLEEGDRLTSLDGVALADREALTEGIATGPLSPRALEVVRGDETLRVSVTPIAGPFAPVPLDAARCADALPDVDATLEFLTSPGTLLGLAVVLAVVLGLLAWGVRRGLPWQESAKVVVPLVGVLLAGPTLGGLLASLLCPALVSWNVRFESVEIFVSEIVLTAMALGLLAYHRGLGPSLTDDQPVLGHARTVVQGGAYVLLWMPRALLLATPVAVFFFAEGALDEAPVAELVAGAGRTHLDAALTFVAAAVLAPIAEESLFRGVLAPHLGRLTDGFRAVLVTAAIFGVLHIGGHGPLFVGPMFLGAILGWARLRSRSLVPSIALHMMLNGTAMLLALGLGLE